MEKEYDTMLEDEEFQIIEEIDLPKQELLIDTVLEDVFHVEKELNFD